MTAALILYTQTACAESGRVRTWLAHHDVAFQERNASRDPAAAQALAATGVFATPLLTCGEDRVLGFRPGALERILLSCARPNSASGE
jgi:glutaredoxin